MGEEAKIVIIKRTGADGPHFPLRRQECLFGRDPSCDLRVQLPGVAMEHAKVIRSEDNSEFYLEILTDNEILVNGNLLKERVQLSNMDVFSIAERSFRFECNQGRGQGKEKSISKSPKKTRRSAGILQEVNEPSVKDSPRTPHPRHPSLRESLGNLRRQSVLFKEEEESNSPNDLESKENNQVHIVHSVVSPKNLPPSHTPKSSKRNSKRVSFGPVLSPEQFNRDLPVKTPIRKGATPRRLSAPLSKSCISPARRRYSVAAPMFASKIEEERESDSDEESKTSVESEEDPSIENQVTSSSKSPKSKRKRMSTPLRKEIEEGAKLRERTEQMATPLKNAIKQGLRLRPSKKKLQTPLKREIKAGFTLRQTKKKLATPIRQAIEEKPSLRATRNKMATPIRKEIETKPSLRPTRKVMDKELQKEITNGVALRKTNKVMPKDLQENIKTGRKLKKIKRRMKPALQEDIVAGKEKLRKTKNKMATPVREEIAKGVTLKTTKRRMATTLQDEIKSGTTALRQTKKSLKTPLRKAIENGIQLRATANEAKQQKDPEASSKTPKRRHSSVDDDEGSSQAVSKNLKTPSRQTPRPAGFHPRTRSVERSTRRKSTKQVPSYAEIVKRPKLTAKRRLTGRRTSLYQFQAEQQVATKAKAKSSTKATTATKVSKLKGKTPTRRKSQARLAKTTNNKKSEDEWQVVVNKRKILRIKRQRAVKSQQEKEEQDIIGVDVLFKTPKHVRAKTDSQSTKTATSTDEKTYVTVSPNLGRKSLGLTGVRRLVKTPKEESEVRLNGLRELMKTPKEEEKIASPCNYGEMRRMFSTPKERRGASDASPNVSILYGVSRLLKSPKVRTSQAESYEGVAELFEEFEMAMPLKATRTPSLRKTAETMTVVASMTPSCTPSLRKRTDKNEVVAPLQTSNTPSLRNAKVQEVSFPLQSSNTPSLRNAKLQEVSFPLQSSNTPSLRNAKLQEVSFPLQSSNTPSLRNAKASSKKVVEKVETLESPADDIVPEPSPQPAPKAATGRRTTRSKRKVEPESLPAAKRPRRTRAQEIASEKASMKTSEPKTGPGKRGSRRTRAKNESDNVVPEMPTNNAVQHPVKTRGKRTAAADLVEPKAKSPKLAPESLVPEKKSRTRRGRPTNDDVVVVVENKNNDSNKRATRSLRNNLNDNPAVEEKTKPSDSTVKQVFATPKIPARSSRKSKNVPGIPETPQPLEVARTKLETIVEVPTPASSIRGNAAGPLFTAVRSSRGRGKCVEVISSKNAETSLKVPTRNSRSRRGKADVEEKCVEEAPGAPAQAQSVKLATRNSRSSRGKRNVRKETEEEELADAIPKRSSRRTKPMVAIVEEEIKDNKITPDAPAAKRTTRGQNNNRKVNEVVAEVRAKKREREVEEVMPEVEPVGLGDQSNGDVRSTRSKRGAAVMQEEKVEAKEQGVMGNSVKRPHRGRKMNENEKSSNDGEENGKSKRGVTKSTTKQATKKEGAGRGKNAKKQTVKNDEKAAISPAPLRVTRSRRNK